MMVNGESRFSFPFIKLTPVVIQGGMAVVRRSGGKGGGLSSLQHLSSSSYTYTT